MEYWPSIILDLLDLDILNILDVLYMLVIMHWLIGLYKLYKQDNLWKKPNQPVPTVSINCCPSSRKGRMSALSPNLSTVWLRTSCSPDEWPRSPWLTTGGQQASLASLRVGQEGSFSRNRSFSHMVRSIQLILERLNCLMRLRQAILSCPGSLSRQREIPGKSVSRLRRMKAIFWTLSPPQSTSISFRRQR